MTVSINYNNHTISVHYYGQCIYAKDLGTRVTDSFVCYRGVTIAASTHVDVDVDVDVMQ